MLERDVNLLATFGTAIGDAVDSRVCEVAGSTGAGPAALAALLASPGIGVDALAIITGVSGSGAVRLVDRLEQTGLVERGPGATGRSVSVRLTRAGTRTARQVLTARAQAVRDLFGVLDDDEQRLVIGAVEKILTAATTSRDAAEHLCRLCDVDACYDDGCPVECAARELEKTR
jgi:MarR family transcriptional repressor of emrRAB